MNLSRAKEDLEKIFRAGVKRVDPYHLIRRSVSINGTRLMIEAGESQKEFDLSNYQKVIVLGFGKATAKMALAVEELFGERIASGFIVVKYGHTESLKRIELMEAGHPVPDENGFKAARIIAERAQQAGENTLVLTLISGGGSALVPYPVEYHSNHLDSDLTLADKQQVTKLLLECGAAITEVNCVRKHLSQIKGGRLVEMFNPATAVNLILSDVVGDRLDSIASGTTVPDESTYQDMADIFDKYGIREKMPPIVQEILTAGLAGEFRETPKSEDKGFSNNHNFLIGTNYLALQAAKQEAEQAGYRTEILTSSLTGEAREVAKVLFAIANETAQHRQPNQDPVCLLFGGETTVTLKGEGLGGRNQEMALAFLAELAKAAPQSGQIFFLAASTDGNDGPTDAAGAFAAAEMLQLVQTQNLSINGYLKQNDSYHFFQQIENLLLTGPTNTNVCDIQLVIIV